MFPSNFKPLGDALETLHAQSGVLEKARGSYFLLEASRKSYEAQLTQKAEGKSQAEKLMNAMANPEWLKFHIELAKAHCDFEFEKLKYEILDKEYLAQYLSMKLDADSIKR